MIRRIKCLLGLDRPYCRSLRRFMAQSRAFKREIRKLRERLQDG